MWYNSCSKKLLGSYSQNHEFTTPFKRLKTWTLKFIFLNKQVCVIKVNYSKIFYRVYLTKLFKDDVCITFGTRIA